MTKSTVKLSPMDAKKFLGLVRQPKQDDIFFDEDLTSVKFDGNDRSSKNNKTSDDVKIAALARSLVDSEKNVRDRGLNRIGVFLTNHGSKLNDKSLSQIWQTIFYAAWLSDMPIPQREFFVGVALLHRRIDDLMLKNKFFIIGFKFYTKGFGYIYSSLLCKPRGRGLALHLISITLDEILHVSKSINTEDADADMDNDDKTYRLQVLENTLLHLLPPFVKGACFSKDEAITRAVHEKLLSGLVGNICGFDSHMAMALKRFSDDSCVSSSSKRKRLLFTSRMFLGAEPCHDYTNCDRMCPEEFASSFQASVFSLFEYNDDENSDDESIVTDKQLSTVKDKKDGLCNKHNLKDKIKQEPSKRKRTESNFIDANDDSHIISGKTNEKPTNFKTTKDSVLNDAESYKENICGNNCLDSKAYDDSKKNVSFDERRMKENGSVNLSGRLKKGQFEKCNQSGDLHEESQQQAVCTEASISDAEKRVVFDLNRNRTVAFAKKAPANSVSRCLPEATNRRSIPVRGNAEDQSCEHSNGVNLPSKIVPILKPGKIPGPADPNEKYEPPVVTKRQGRDMTQLYAILQQIMSQSGPNGVMKALGGGSSGRSGSSKTRRLFSGSRRRQKMKAYKYCLKLKNGMKKL